MPRDGYGVDESGYPTYSAPTEKYPDYQQPGAYGTSPNPYAAPNQYGGDQYGAPGQQQYGTPNPYAAPNQYGPPNQYGGAPNQHGGAPNQYGAAGQYGGPAPQYGAPNPYGATYPQSRGTNGLAIASLITSIVGGCFYGVGSIVGIILGIVALGQIKQSGQEGRGLAIAGIAIGGAYVVGWILFFVIMLIAAASGA
ncbi:DUF4190 domain-containing protein [Rhodococcus pseudokoreensis]|uniref:DUF4190 domain-containing protein n=1 Tax=Rhodococcus pseudokoreensis TaxID=2811421 RepID=A0A974WCM3_9NOCA|nr:DUF4190 domain-containing protein [Rhodococcus pseudokoreensis]QSE95504.1 DUF4190 domain-containing protein [Rhodococcus pseudokoreensis]